jgi:hypothetical protein
MAFYSIEPFGFHATWAPFAHLMALLANINRNPKKAKQYKAEDFMPKEQGSKDGMDAEHMKRMAKAITEMFGGRVRSKMRPQA